MKKSIMSALVPAFVFFVFVYAFAQDLEIESKITQVTVYPADALVTRASTLKLNPGELKVTFPNIIPEVDENSLRVSGNGNAEVKILGAQVKREFLEEAPAERAKQIRVEIQSLGDEIRKLEDAKNILSQEKEFLDSIKLFSGSQLPKDLVTKMPQAKELEDILKFLDDKLKDNFSRVIDADLKIREIQKKIDVLNRELAQVSGPNKKMKRSIVVDLEILKSGSFNLDISYLVRGASWQPIYDARANFEKSEVEFISRGLIRQNTGEDWQDVEISLSTAKPAIGGSLPYVEPWFIRPYQPLRLEEKEVKGRFGHFKSAPVSASQFQAYDKMEVSGVAGGPQEGISPYAQAEEKGVAIVYKLPRKADIKSDGSEHKLPISSQILKAAFEYSAYPRIAPYAYLGSRVTNAKDLQLLAGRVNIFLDGDFVGSSAINNIGPQEEFDVYLGVDENVKVKREEIEKKVDDVLIAGIPSPTRKVTYKYKLSLENYKNKKSKVLLFEAIPVSQDERIKVNVSNVSLAPKEKDWKDRKGVWRWELELEPKQKQEIFYTYSVECPRDMLIEGL